MLRWIYIISIVLSLWTVYLLAFKTYTKKRHQKDWEQVVYPMIIYFLSASRICPWCQSHYGINYHCQSSF